MMNFASLFNYFEAGLWFSIALILLVCRKDLLPELKRLASIVGISFAVFGFSDIIEASTGAWWRPLGLLGLKGLCILSFICCWIKYSKINK